MHRTDQMLRSIEAGGLGGVDPNVEAVHCLPPSARQRHSTSGPRFEGGGGRKDNSGKSINTG